MQALAILSGPLLTCICAVGLLCILVWALAVFPESVRWVVYQAKQFWREITLRDFRDVVAISGSLPLSSQYDVWFSEVHRIAALMGWTEIAMQSIDKMAWREYFDEKYTPAEAWMEEFDSATR